MPAEDYFCPDNFFKKMTDLESPKKNNDCYFYYYSTCAKGDSCQFRHEPAALGCETMCSFWKEGKCLNIHCNFRHMELRKNRKAIPCYWESQPKGCLKAHCPFMHQLPRPFDNGSDKLDEISRPDSVFKDQSERRVTAVDSLVVNFEEESDNESIPSFSPLKNPNRIVRVKTLEEIRLEKIQAESAAFYSYHDEDLMTPEDADDLRQRLVPRISTRLDRRFSAPPNFRNSTISKIRANKRLSEDELANILGDDSLRKKSKIVVEGDEGNLKVIVNSRPTSQVSVTPDERQKKMLVKPSLEKCESTSNIRVKTLAELRAERNMKVRSEVEQQEDVVTSTSMEDRIQKTSQSAPKRKIKLRRKPVPRKDLTEFEQTESTVTKLSDNEDMLLTNNSDTGSNVDESMLLSDDDDLDSMALGAEDELLNEVEDF